MGQNTAAMSPFVPTAANSIAFALPHGNKNRYSRSGCLDVFVRREWMPGPLSDSTTRAETDTRVSSGSDAHFAIAFWPSSRWLVDSGGLFGSCGLFAQA